RRVGQHGAADAVEAADIDDAVHHRHVADADVWPHLARGEGADHDLGDAERQRAHGGGADGGAGAAAEAQGAVEAAFVVQLAGDGGGAAGGGVDGPAAVAGGRDGVERRGRGGGDLLAGGVRRG